MSLVLMRADISDDGKFRFVNTKSGEQSLVGTGYLEIELDPVLNKTGDCWHICVEGMRDPGSMCYAWRASGAEGKLMTYYDDDVALFKSQACSALWCADDAHLHH
jgi:hypothetical protein